MAVRDPKTTRSLLVAAALAALRDLRVEDLITAVGTREIARRAGVSPATVFHHFGSVEGLSSAVVARVFDRSEVPDATVNAKLSGMRDSKRPASSGIEMHRSEFERLLNDPGHRLRLGLWAFGGDEARTAYGNYNRVLDDVVSDRSRVLFESWGRELRPPFDVSMLIAAQSALVTGSVVRHVADPAAVDRDRFGMVATALTLVMLRGAGDTFDLQDRLAEMDRFILREPSGQSSLQRTRTRARVLESAQAVFQRVGYEQATVGAVARDAHVAPTTVYGLFNGKEELAVSLMAEQASHLDAPSGHLESDLGVIADFVFARSDYAAPYVARLATGGVADGDPLVAHAVRALDMARADEATDQLLTSAALARTLLLVLASRVLSAPATGSVGAVEHVRLLLGR